MKRTAIFTQNILNKHKRPPTHTKFIIIMKALPTALVAAGIIALATAFDPIIQGNGNPHYTPQKMAQDLERGAKAKGNGIFVPPELAQWVQENSPSDRNSPLGNYNAETFGSVGGKQRKKTQQPQAAPAAAQPQNAHAPAPAQQFKFQSLNNFDIRPRPKESRPQQIRGRVINHKFIQKSPAAKSSTSNLGEDAQNKLLDKLKDYTPEAVVHRFKEQHWGNAQSKDPMDQLLELDGDKLLEYDKDGKLPKRVTDTDTDMDMDALLEATRKIALQDIQKDPIKSQNP